jgi:hypothetical protein
MKAIFVAFLTIGLTACNTQTHSTVKDAEDEALSAETVTILSEDGGDVALADLNSAVNDGSVIYEYHTTVPATKVAIAEFLWTTVFGDAPHGELENDRLSGNAGWIALDSVVNQYSGKFQIYAEDTEPFIFEIDLTQHFTSGSYNLYSLGEDLGTIPDGLSFIVPATSAARVSAQVVDMSGGESQTCEPSVIEENGQVKVQVLAGLDIDEGSCSVQIRVSGRRSITIGLENVGT